MILYENGYIRLDYAPSTDILCIEYPDMQEFELLHIHKAINIILEAITNYDIKKCLLDTSNTEMEVGDDNHSVVMHHLASGFMNTRLQKVARVASGNAAREKRVDSFVREVQQEAKPVIAYQNFTDRAAAVDWLLGE